MGETVSLDGVRELIAAMVRDAVGRRLTGDAHTPRHIVVTGPLGSGKRTAATLMARALAILDPRPKLPSP